LKYIISTLTVLGLAGCSGGSGGAPNLAHIDQALALAAAQQAANVSVPSELPTSGAASYAGFVTLGLPISDAITNVTGDIDLNVDFGNQLQPFSGTLSHFPGLAGQIAIVGGQIDRDANTGVDYTFISDLRGDLVAEGRTYTINGSLAGDFRGRYQDGMTGVIYGDIDGPVGQNMFSGTMAVARID
jgi:hypothetical protein